MRVFNIQWDDDQLPNEVDLDIPRDVDPMDLEQLVSDLLTDRFGETPNGFETSQ